jgi:hypothetical protein
VEEEEAPSCSASSNTDVYERRIAPLLTDDRPSTCNECHLSGVDLSLYVKRSPCKTMACMVDQGVVDLDSPDDSLVLDWILRAEPAGLITQDVIDAEHDGVRQWIEYMNRCGPEVCQPYANPCGKEKDEFTCDLSEPRGPSPYADPGDCSDATLEALWYSKVYAWRQRCYPCHFVTFDVEASNLDSPLWIEVGDCEIGSLRTFRNAQEAGYLDPDDPMQSLLLLKPLEEDLGGVEHGGNPKIHSTHEGAYIDFVSFLARYAGCR